MKKSIILTSESVSQGHPDKLADQISDAILDESLEQDPDARVAVETLLTRGIAIVAGELTCRGYVDIPKIVRRTIIDAGYNHPELGFDGHTCGVMVSIQEQSPDIAVGVDHGGAGDQGIMYGYAVNETPELMPLPISIAHTLMAKVTAVQKENPELGFRPDAKAQVSVLYENGIPKKLTDIVLSVQHNPTLTHQEVIDKATHWIIEPVLHSEKYNVFYDSSLKIHINPTGIFTVGGPEADTGLTGRKIMVDTYGGICLHGGGAFSGKDPTKVDRSAAYIARHVAKCIVAAGLASKAQVSLVYAIGMNHPIAIDIDTFNTESMDLENIKNKVKKVFDFSPLGIAKHLNLYQIKYLPTAKNGHFGHQSFPWEDTTFCKELK